jgi:hypothetical protein
MAKLKAKARNALPKSAFGLPESRKYPMPNRSHAANAKARAAQELEAGNLSQEQHDRIVRMADRILYSGE